MKKTGIYPNLKPVLKTGKAILTGSKPAGLTSGSPCRISHAGKVVSQIRKVIPANSKVNKTNNLSSG
ncbi:MAG: hypothetical protein LBK58_12130 [Prevotellaceae bacterium]|jgi:hypothetical protein|nr:hypothetical protein [Prevotellaceae bacterium]